MSQRWVLVIILTVITLTALSGWQIYKAFTTKKEVEKYRVYVSPIEKTLDTALVKKIDLLQDNVPVRDSDIQPK